MSTAITIRPRSPNGPPGYGAELVLEPRSTAVLIVDVQRYFVESLPFEAMQRAIEPIARLLPAARNAGMTVVHVKTEFRADLADAGRPGSRTRQMMDSVASGLVRGSRGAEIVPALSPAPQDLVVIKKRFSGFAGTELHALLAARGIESVILAGGTTTVCVESTLRDALFLEYNAVLLADCTADMSDALHESALARIDHFFGWVTTSSELLVALLRDPGDARSASFLTAASAETRADSCG
jgi:ureidoacrylate peracid hydrolase